jgi:general nucleoside transport system ATP-binding protein
MTDEPILVMKGIKKSFGTNAALQDVNFTLAVREIHGLLGGNGAGKTTLMNILFGLYRADSGEIILHGKRVDIHSPKDAIRLRIGMVHQQFLQIKSFSVLQNVVLGTSVKNKFRLNLAEEEKKVRELSARFGLDVDPQALIEDLPMGVRQKVEILKALYRGVEILILDEPTTNLTPQEVDGLFQSLRVMVKEGMSIVFITHKLREVLSVCDRISVLRNGNNVMTLKREESSEEAFVRGMVGEELDLQSSVVFSQGGLEESVQTVGQNIVLQLDQVQLLNEEGRSLIKGITFEIREGEIFGVAGVADNGQKELAEVILGIQPASSGCVRLYGNTITHKPTSDLLESGISYIPEDCLRDGFLPKASVAQNLILGFHKQKPYSRNGFMDLNAILNAARGLISDYNIKTQGPTDTGANLSGGNIQRVVVSRAFSRPCKLLVAHNPTRGLDIPSIDFVYSRLLQNKKNGMATLLISENLDELLLLCNRIAVLYRGEVVGVLDRAHLEKYEIGRMMSGVRTDA